MTKEIQIYGPYFTNYSYARVNRGLALGLQKVQQDYAVSLFCDPAKIEFNVKPSDLEKRPALKSLVRFEPDKPHVVIYNNFPKTGMNTPHGLKDLAGDIKIMYIAWEESIYPEDWVDEINENLHGVMAATSFVREILRNSGVKVPIVVVPNAMEDQMKLPVHHSGGAPRTTYPLETSRNFKFLHISTAKKRKGIDVLLKAYFSEFTREDDVVLVIKSSPSPENSVEQMLNELRTENSPEVIHISNPDLTEEDMTSLVQQSDCAVYPSRAEGFGLPILESMFWQKPVIATNYSGYLDFCDEDCAWMIDYKLQYANDSESPIIGAKWAEPDLEDLKHLMREQYDLKKNPSEKKLEVQSEKIKLAKERADAISWESSAKMALDFVQQLEKIYELKAKTAGVISFINDETGIAEYTDDLYKKIENSFANFYYFGNADLADKIRKDDPNVLRLWSTGEKDFSKLKEWLIANHLDIMHIQYHSGSMFPPESLDKLIQLLKYLNIKVFVTLHAVKGDSFDFIKTCRNLNLAEKVFIHNKADFDYAKTKLDNVSLFTIPVHLVQKFNKQKLKKSLGIEGRLPVIATHGLLNKNKGIDSVVKAISLLHKKYPKILFLSLSAISSNNIYAQGLFDEIKNLVIEDKLEDNVRIITDFLNERVVNLLLQACDINVFAYSDAGESGSAAVRKGLNAMNPTIVTDIVQFAEFDDEVLKIPNNDPKFIATAIDNLLLNTDEIKKMKEQARDFVQKNNYETKSLAQLQEY